MQKTSDVEFWRQIVRVLKVDASVPVGSRVFMSKRALNKYLVDSGLTDMVRPGSAQYTLRHGEMLVEPKAVVMEPLEFRLKVAKETRLDLVVHDPDAPFNIIHQQRRDQVVIKVNDAARRQTATRHNARSVLLRGPSRRAMLVTNPPEARVPRPLPDERRAEPSVRENNVFCLRQARSQAMGLPPKPAEQGLSLIHI